MREKSNVVRQDALHEQVHTGQVVGALDELLRIVNDIIFGTGVLGKSFSNSDEQRTGTARRVYHLRVFDTENDVNRGKLDIKQGLLRPDGSQKPSLYGNGAGNEEIPAR